MRKYYRPSPRSKLYTNSGMYKSFIKSFFQNKNSKASLDSKFTKTISAFFNVDSKSILPCSMARAGIYLALDTIISRERNEVILSPYTISDVVNMVLCAGGTPIFCDTDRNSCNIDTSKIKDLITPKTAAVMVTHFYGLASNIKSAKTICEENEIPLIEDAAQAFGVKVDGQYVGTFGTVGVFNFGLYKNITSFVGGVLIVNDEKLKNSISLKINKFNRFSFFDLIPKVMKGGITDIVTSPLLFKTFFYSFFRWATLKKKNFINNNFKIDINPVSYNSFPENYKKKINNFQLNLIISQLPKVIVNQKVRIKNSLRYYSGLKHLSDFMILPPIQLNGSHGYQYFIIQVPDRDRLEEYMLGQDCDIMKSYHRNCADLHCFSQYFNECQNARATANSVIYLPTYPGYLNLDIERNIKAISSFFNS